MGCCRLAGKRDPFLHSAGLQDNEVGLQTRLIISITSNTVMCIYATINMITFLIDLLKTVDLTAVAY